MDSIGIDLHKRESQLCTITEDGELLEQRIVARARTFPPTVSVWRRRVMQHVDVRTDEDRQQVLRTLQRTGVGRPGLREDPLGVGAVRVDGQTRRDAPEHLAGLLRRRVVRDDRPDDGFAGVVGPVSQLLGIEDLVHEHVGALRVTHEVLRDPRVAGQHH